MKPFLAQPGARTHGKRVWERFIPWSDDAMAEEHDRMGKLLLVLKVELGNGTTGAIEVGSGAEAF